MLRVNHMFTILVLVALIFSACQPITRPPAATPQPPQGLRPDAPPYAVHGPHAVGARDFTIQDGDHTVLITVWYPALNPTQAKEELIYPLNDQLPNIASLKLAKPPTVKGQALAKATPDTAHGPYPLVIFAPGLGGWRQTNSFLLEHLASYGFIAIAPDIRGESWDSFWAGAATRMIDTKLIIAYAEKLTNAQGELAGLIDIKHTATVGHSSGGWAALAGGGARFDFGWCAANPDLVAKNDLSNCTQFVPHQAEIAKMLGLAAAPQGMWPPLNDPRVTAVVALAPDGDIWGANYEGIAALKVPTLVMAGSNDTVNVPERCAYPIYEHLGSAKKSLVVFGGGDHMIFFNQCRDTPWLADVNYAYCSDAVWEMDRVHDLINHFVTAFLLVELKGDTEAAKALAPDKVTFPGVRYETTAFAK